MATGNRRERKTTVDRLMEEGMVIPLGQRAYVVVTPCTPTLHETDAKSFVRVEYRNRTLPMGPKRTQAVQINNLTLEMATGR